MKKYFCFIFSLIILLSISLSCYATENNENVKALINKEISIVYNNDLKSFFDVNGTSVSPISYNNTTYLPIRSISAMFDIPVQWDATNNKVLLGKGDIVSTTAKTIDNFTKGKNEEVELLLNRALKIEYNNKVQTFTDANGVVVYPLSYNGTTYLPVRAIANMYGSSVDWNEENERITLAIDENRVAQITDVIIKVIDNTLCTEIKTDVPLKSYTEYLLGEGRVVAEPYLNMRAASTTNADIIEKIPQGTVITVKKVVSGNNSEIWYQVAYADKIGYVSANYINIMSTRLLIDLENTQFANIMETQEIDYSNIKTIRFGNQGNNVNRIVLDLKDVTKYSVSQSLDKRTTYLALSETFELKENITEKDYVLVASIGNQIFIPEIDKPVEPPKQENPVTPVLPNTSGEVSGDSSGDINNEIENKPVTEEKEPEKEPELTEAQKAKMAKITSVVYSSSMDKTTVKITGNYDYEKFLLSDPNRLVIDIENALLEVDGPKEIEPKNKSIDIIRFAQYEKDKVRIVFEFDKSVDYGIVEKYNGLEIKIDEPEYRNIEYNAKTKYAELRLQDVKKKVFSISETTRTNKITITYASSKFDSGKTTLKPKDEFVETIDIRTNKITITGAQKISYEMYQDGDDVVLKIYEKGKEPSKNNTGDFIVLLDAGHGGSDPGACRGATNEEKHLPENQEKNYTLTVMKMVQEMLEDTDGIQVEVSRSKDVYMDREDRVDFILDNPEANLLVSVHVNSHATSKPNGLEVLYCNKPDEKEDYGITSKELALILLDCFEDELDINIRGLSGRNGEELWILEQNSTGAISNYTKEDRPVTNLPAVICELCFITNDDDFERLVTDEFQEAAAKAIYEGILEAKEQMEG